MTFDEMISEAILRGKKGFSLIELLIVIAIILVIAAIAIPSLIKARISANEASAISSLRTIATAQISHKILNDVYAPDLATLGPGRANLLTGVLGVAPYQHSGYQFSTSGTAGTFELGAVPLSANSGIRSFCTNTPAVVFFSPTASGCDPKTSSPIVQ